jgi:hypothetical protein
MVRDFEGVSRDVLAGIFHYLPGKNNLGELASRSGFKPGKLTCEYGFMALLVQEQYRL